MQQLVLGLQWVAFHAGVVLSGPVILGNALQLTPDQTGSLIQLTLVLTGSANILQAIVGHRQTLLEGPAVPWLSGYLVLAGVAVSAGTTMAVVRTNIEGAMIIAGAVLVVAGLLGIIRRLSFIFTPRISGVLLMLIGIQISAVGIRGLISSGLPMFVIGAGVLLLTVVLLTRTRGILRNSALLIAVIVGWIVSALVSPGVQPAGPSLSFLALPRILPWGAPTFDPGSIISLTVLGLLMIPNQVGALKAMEATTGSVVPPRRYDRGVATSGLACAAAGLTGGIGTAPFAISAGLVAVSKERTNRPYLIGAGLFILIGLIPPLGRFFSSIPESIAGAVLLISVGSLAVIGMQSATSEPLDVRRSSVVGLGLLTGTGIMFIPGAFWTAIPYWLASVLSNGIITGTLVAILLEQTVMRRAGSAEGPDGS